MKHSSIGCAPADIILSKAVNLERNFFPQDEEGKILCDVKRPLNEYLAKLLEIQPRVITLARKAQEETNKRHIRVNIDRITNKFDINDWVMLNIPNSFLQGDSRPDKLSHAYNGLYQIIKIDRETNSVSLKNEIKNQVLNDISISHIHPFNYDKEAINPAQVQAHVSDEFFVEKILKHRGKFDKNRKYLKKTFEVRVRWKGYDEKHDSWEPFTLIRDNEIFHQYAIRHNMIYMLSKEAKIEYKRRIDSQNNNIDI